MAARDIGKISKKDDVVCIPATLAITEIGITRFVNLLKNTVSTNTGKKPRKHCLDLTQLHLISKSAGERSLDKSGFTFTRITDSEHIRLQKPPDNFSRLFKKQARISLLKKIKQLLAGVTLGRPEEQGTAELWPLCHRTAAQEKGQEQGIMEA